MRRSLIVFLALCATVSFAQQQRTECCEEYCYGSDSDRPQTQRFGSKSVYQIARGVDMSRHSVIPNCRPVKFWMMARHGARLPTANNMQKLKTLIDLRDQVIENYELRRTKPDVGHLCDADYGVIKNWRWDSNITGNYNEFLTVQGYNDEKFLAKNFQRILPNVLENVYSADKFLFRYTPTQRTEASFKAFAEGLFGDNAFEHVRAEQVPANDSLMNSHFNCPVWQENEQRISDSSSEVNKFIASSIYQSMLQEVSTRLGFKLVLTPFQVDLIWDMCRFEQSWYIEQLSPWCAAFTKSHVAVLEYKEDLVAYYKTGYGNSVNENLACTTMTDMLKHLKSRTGPQVVATFGHSANVQLLISAMGVLKDVHPLTADNYYQQKRRQFRSSRIDPFSANLVAIAYDCDDVERQKVMFFLNEKPLELPWCRVGLCDWSQVEQHYQKYLSEIDCSREFCQQNSAGVMGLASLITVVGMTLMTLLVKY